MSWTENALEMETLDGVLAKDLAAEGLCVLGRGEIGGKVSDTLQGTRDSMIQRRFNESLIRDVHDVCHGGHDPIFASSWSSAVVYECTI